MDAHDRLRDGLYRRAHEGGETGPAYGAARLARIAATGELPEAVCLPPQIADVTEPDPKLADLFGRQRERFAALYSAVRLEFRRQTPSDSPFA